jgi:tetrahydromethanopterin S-methyltransferase subunit F
MRAVKMSRGVRNARFIGLMSGVFVAGFIMWAAATD